MGLLDGLLGSLAAGMGGGLGNATGNATGNAPGMGSPTDNPLGNILGSILGGGVGNANSRGAGGMSGGVASAAALTPLIMMAMQMIQQHGGLSGILGKLQQQGLGPQVDSWVKTDSNLPVSGGKLSEILGSGSIGQVAQQLGVSQDQAANGLAAVLPQIISHLTPDGTIPANHNDTMSQILAELSAHRA